MQCLHCQCRYDGCQTNILTHVTSVQVPQNYLNFPALSASRLWEQGDDAELQDCHIRLCLCTCCLAVFKTQRQSKQTSAFSSVHRYSDSSFSWSAMRGLTLFIVFGTPAAGDVPFNFFNPTSSTALLFNRILYIPFSFLTITDLF